MPSCLESICTTRRENPSFVFLKNIFLCLTASTLTFSNRNAVEELQKRHCAFLPAQTSTVCYCN
uniref:Uncharacterized protein n=1 Tax=Anguilla anguilla TaxID=7936 RepID=A0A0E9X0V0_ANGAN